MTPKQVVQYLKDFECLRDLVAMLPEDPEAFEDLVEELYVLHAMITEPPTEIISLQEMKKLVEEDDCRRGSTLEEWLEEEGIDSLEEWSKRSPNPIFLDPVEYERFQKIVEEEQDE